MNKIDLINAAKANANLIKDILGNLHPVLPLKTPLNKETPKRIILC